MSLIIFHETAFRYTFWAIRNGGHAVPWHRQWPGYTTALQSTVWMCPYKLLVCWRFCYMVDCETTCVGTLMISCSQGNKIKSEHALRTLDSCVHWGKQTSFSTMTAEATHNRSFKCVFVYIKIWEYLLQRDTSTVYRCVVQLRTYALIFQCSIMFVLPSNPCPHFLG